MRYWRGVMDWPMKPDWLCPICGENQGLTWGFVHAECRCNRCHAVFTMRDSEGVRLREPKCLLRKEYFDVASSIWHETWTPLDQVDDETWAKFMQEQTGEKGNP